MSLLLLLLSGQDLDLPGYRSRLGSLKEAIDRGDLEAARAGARSLLQAGRVRTAGEELAVDVTLLRPLAEAKDVDALKTQAPRLAGLLAALDGEESPAAREADPALLERLRREQEVEAPRRGGSVWEPPSPQVPVSLWDRVISALEWLGDRVAALWRWLREAFGFRRSGGSGGGTGMPLLVVVLALAVAALLALLAFAAWRRRTSGPAAASSRALPAAAPRDEDPLSRTANEWERFARELAQAGRLREAVRAWYHAALVMLFRAGALHYRRERTNWDYAYALPSQAPWREDFQDLTRVFEREWYGRRETSAETEADFEGRALRLLASLRPGGGR